MISITLNVTEDTNALVGKCKKLLCLKKYITYSCKKKKKFLVILDPLLVPAKS